MRNYQFKTMAHAANLHQTTKESTQPHVVFNSRVENKQSHNLTHGLGSNTNIQEMKDKLNDLLRQTELLSDRKNVSLGKNQKSAGFGSSKFFGNSSGSSESIGNASEYKFGSRLNASNREGWGLDAKKEEVKDVPRNQGNQSGSRELYLQVDSSRLQSSPKVIFSDPQRNGLNSPNNNNFRNVVFNGQAHKFTYESSFQAAPRNNNTSSGRIENFNEVENYSKISEQKIPISQPSQPTKSNLTQSKQPGYLQFSSNSIKQKTNISQNTIQSPSKFTVHQSLSPRPSLTNKFQTNGYPSSSTSFSFPSDYGFAPSTPAESKKQQHKPLQIPANLSECQYKLRFLDQQCRKLRQQIVELADGKEYYRKELSQQWRNNKKLKQQHELRVEEIKKQHRQEIQKYVDKNYKTIDEYEEKIKEIKKQQKKELEKVEDIVKLKQKNISELINQLADAKVKPVYQSYELKANKIISENKQLIDTLISKQSELASLKTELNQKSTKVDQLSDRILVLEKQVAELGNFKDTQTSGEGENFDAILMMQLKSISEFKNIIERLNEKNTELNQKLFESNRKNQLNQNEHRISELKTKSIINNLTVQSGILESNKQNQISTLSKKLLTLEEKYKTTLNQIKKKDEFMKQHLVGRTDMIDVKEYIESFLSKYRQYFSESREEELKQQLEKAMIKIELYEKYK